MALPLRANPVSFDRMSEADLVSLVGGISEKRATQLLLALGGFHGLIRAGVGELAAVAGHAPAARIAAALELGHRVLEQAARPAEIHLPNATAVYAWARTRLALLDHEELWILSVDGLHALISARLVAAGGLHGLHVSARDIVRVAIREGATGFILVHDHPSGDPTPSDEDIAFTQAVANAADIVGTALLDHVVVARGSFVSMLNEGLLAAMPRRRAG